MHAIRNSPCVRPAGIRAVCKRFHHRGNEREHHAMGPSRNLGTRFRIDRSFPSEQKRGRGDAPRVAYSPRRSPWSRLCRWSRLSPPRNTPLAPDGRKDLWIHQSWKLQVMRKLVLSLLFLTIDHLEEAWIEKEVKRMFNGTMEFKNQRIPDSKNLLVRRSWQLWENWDSRRIKHLWKLSGSADLKNFTIYRYRCRLKLKDVKFLRKIFNDRWNAIECWAIAQHIRVRRKKRHVLNS